VSQKEINIEVTENDILKSRNNPTKCPVSRAISRKLDETLSDVEVVGDYVYIWDEWDHPSVKFEIDKVVVDLINRWQELGESQEEISPFEFKIKKRK